MKMQILDIDERSKWDDEVVGHWEKDFRMLGELQGRGVTIFNGFGHRELDQKKICGEQKNHFTTSLKWSNEKIRLSSTIF